MSKSPSDPRSKKPYPRDRRAPRGTPGSVRWVKGLLGRPLALERRGVQLHVTLVERRRAPEAIEADELRQLRIELRARLLEHENKHAAAVMRHLGVVHDVLGRKGWPGVGMLTSRVLGRALVQAQMLASEEASSRLDHLIEQLQVLKVAAIVREDRDGMTGQGGAPGFDSTRTTVPAPLPGSLKNVDLALEVSETTAEDFEELERSWVDTVSPALDGRDAGETASSADEPAPPDSAPH